jgi:Zn-dependent protease
MISQLFTNPLNFLIYLIAAIISIAIHEFAHAATADVLGDDTPRNQGRLSLNPIDHLDPLGMLLLVFSGFGWGKPVPINPLQFSNPRLGTALVSVAGPGSNLLLAGITALALRVLSLHHLPSITVIFLVVLIKFNVVFPLFNLLPISPLDGFKLVAGLLPLDLADQWLELRKYGLIILIVLLLPFGLLRPIDVILQPPISFLQNLLLPFNF